MRTGRWPGSSGAAVAFVFLQAWLLFLLPLVAASPASASPRKKTKAAGAEASTALLGGTVFRDAGFALRGAEIVVTRASDQPGGGNGPAAPAGGEPRKGKPESWKAVSDARGEFLLRLPAGPARYTISVRAAGCKPQEKSIAFTADERLDQNFLLEPAGSAK